ncbi:MAG: anti-sigma factor, partial [Gaiellaceae bacterium MAG52_C11]|nr:anti-sigma factor [Candidatus Gaiellasilicea maunaloa]
LASGGGLLAAVGIAVSLAVRPVDSFPPAGAASALRPAAGVAATASVRLSARPWGTQVDLAASRLPVLPAGSYYEVWLVRADGTRLAAGTFRPTAPDGRARVRLAAALPLAAIVRIGVTREGAGGTTDVLAGAPSART